MNRKQASSLINQTFRDLGIIALTVTLTNILSLCWITLTNSLEFKNHKQLKIFGHASNGAMFNNQKNKETLLLSNGSFYTFFMWCCHFPGVIEQNYQSTVKKLKIQLLYLATTLFPEDVRQFFLLTLKEQVKWRKCSSKTRNLEN